MRTKMSLCQLLGQRLDPFSFYVIPYDEDKHDPYNSYMLICGITIGISSLTFSRTFARDRVPDKTIY